MCRVSFLDEGNRPVLGTNHISGSTSTRRPPSLPQNAGKDTVYAHQTVRFGGTPVDCIEYVIAVARLDPPSPAARGGGIALAHLLPYVRPAPAALLRELDSTVQQPSLSLGSQQVACCSGEQHGSVVVSAAVASAMPQQ